jgi:hypothetical protein
MVNFPWFGYSRLISWFSLLVFFDGVLIVGVGVDLSSLLLEILREHGEGSCNVVIERVSWNSDYSLVITRGDDSAENKR